MAKDLLGHELNSDLAEFEPPYIDDVGSFIRTNADKIPVIVIRNKKQKSKILTECKPEEIILYVTKMMEQGHTPSVIE